MKSTYNFLLAFLLCSYISCLIIWMASRLLKDFEIIMKSRPRKLNPHVNTLLHTLVYDGTITPALIKRRDLHLSQTRGNIYVHIWLHYRLFSLRCLCEWNTLSTTFSSALYVISIFSTLCSFSVPIFWSGHFINQQSYRRALTRYHSYHMCKLSALNDTTALSQTEKWINMWKKVNDLSGFISRIFAERGALVRYTMAGDSYVVV